MKLKKVCTVELVPTTPFDFDSTFHKPAHFASGDNHWEKGTRWQTFFCNNEKLGVVFKNAGTRSSPCISVLVHCNKRLSDKFIKGFIDEIKYRYNLDLDLTYFYRKFEKVSIIGPAIKRLNGMRPGHQDSLYEYLIIGILLQNCTVRRSIAMMQVLFEKYGTILEYDGKKMWCFWEPGGLKNITEDELRGLKLGYRAKFIKKIDDYFYYQYIDELALREAGLQKQKEELLKLYGVGPATVWYLLFDVFHQYDFFEHISPWEQKIYSKLFFDKDPENPVPVKKLLKHFEKYKPYQQLAVHYIWEDLWWTRLRLSYGGQGRKNESIAWLEKLIRV